MKDEHLDTTPDTSVMRPRYFMRLAYDGTRYHGWQRQPNAHSVQAEIEQALSKLLRQSPVITTGCGRTDTGVHASDFYLHFDTHNIIEDTTDLLFRLNNFIPKDIGVYGIWRVPDKAHARFDAIERSYEYHIHNRRIPFVRHYSSFYPYQLDIERMNEAAQLMIGQRDFAVFCKSGGGQNTTICDVRYAQWIAKDGQFVFHITADRFLRNMVRAVVGTLCDVGRGKITVEGFGQILQETSRSMSGESVYATGLTLTQVKYPSELMTLFVAQNPHFLRP